MNKNLNIALKSRSTEQGFALPTAVGMGLIMILIGTTLIMRSQSDLVSASAQKDTAQSLSVNEVGVTRTLAAFKQNLVLVTTPYNWATNITTGWTTGGGSSLVGVTADKGWITLSGFGHFKIDKYTPNTPSAGIGTLEVSGTTDTNTAILKSTNVPQTAISSLSVEISQSTLTISSWQRKDAL